MGFKIHGWIFAGLFSLSLQTEATVPFAFWKMPDSTPIMCSPGNYGPDVTLYRDDYTHGEVKSMLLNGSTMFISGTFHEVQGQTREYFAALNPQTGSVHSLNLNPDGPANSILLSGSTLFIGGSFSTVGPEYMTGGIPVSATKGVPNTMVPIISGPVYASVADGSGGWFIGGNFTRINGVTRNRIARINSDGSLHAFSPSSDGTIRTMSLSGTTLYVGGEFQEIGGLYRRRLAALDATQNSNNATAWNPSIDGMVSNLLLSGSTLFITGSFEKVNNFYPGSGQQVSTSGLVHPSFPEVVGTIKAVVPDGSGGWIIGGEFTRVGSTNRSYLARINSDGSLHAFDPQPSGIVYDLAISGNTLFVAGNFWQIGGQYRRNLAALDITQNTNNATTWNPNLDGRVERILLNGSTLFISGPFEKVNDFVAGMGVPVSVPGVIPTNFPETNGQVKSAIPDGSGGWIIGGSFTRVGSSTRTGIARVNSDGSLHAFNPNASWAGLPESIATVNTLARDGSIVYAGGEFDTLGGYSRNNVGAVDIDSGAANTWNPGADNAVEGLMLNGSTLYISGAFQKLAGVGRSYLGALNTGSDTALSWNPNLNITSDRVRAMLLSGTILYLGGGFDQILGQSRSGLAAVSTSDGSLLAWNPDQTAIVRAMSLNGTILYIGGNFVQVNSTARAGLAAVSTVTGGLTSWNPNPDGSTEALYSQGTLVFAGGYFGNIGGASRRYLAAISSMDASATAWNPNPNSEILLLSGSGTTFFAGGSFTSIGGSTSRPRLAAIATTSTINNALSWPTAAPSWYPMTMAADSSNLYIGGIFTSIGTTSRSNLASISRSSGTLNSWNPAPDALVTSLQQSGTLLYAGGAFSTIASTSRSGLAAFSTVTGNITGWNPSQNGVAQTIFLDAGTLYVGGSFGTIGGQTRNGLASISTSSGLATSWDPDAKSPSGEFAFAQSGTLLYVGGDFTSMGGSSKRYRLAALDTTVNTNNALSWNPPRLGGYANALAQSGTILYVGGGFTSLGTSSRSYLAAISTANSSILSWNPNSNGNVEAIAQNGTILYVGGNFSNIGAQGRAYIAAVNTTNGNATAWNPISGSEVLALHLSGTTLYVGGDFYSIGGKSRRAVAALTTAINTNNALDLNFSLDGSAQPMALSLSGTNLFIGMSNSNAQLGAYVRNALASYDLDTNSWTDWAPGDQYSYVNAMTLSGTILYVGGYFSNLGGVARSSIGAVDTSTGTATAWNPTSNGDVNTMVQSGTLIYVGGLFSNIGGQARSRIAALRTTPNTSNASAWNPNSDGDVHALALNGTILYVGGQFTTIGGQARNNAAALRTSPNTNNANSWNPNPNNQVFAMATNGTSAYLGGNFFSFGTISQNYIAKVHATSGTLETWNPNPNGFIQSLILDGSRLHIGGTFYDIGGSSNRMGYTNMCLP